MNNKIEDSESPSERVRLQQERRELVSQLPVLKTDLVALRAVQDRLTAINARLKELGQAEYLENEARSRATKARLRGRGNELLAESISIAAKKLRAEILCMHPSRVEPHHQEFFGALETFIAAQAAHIKSGRAVEVDEPATAKAEPAPADPQWQDTWKAGRE